MEDEKEIPRETEPEATEEEKSTETAPEAHDARETPPQEPAVYAFRWDYKQQYEEQEKRKKTLRVRAGLFYTLILVTVFAVAFALLSVVLLIGNRRGFLGAGGKILATTERVVYVNGDGDAEEELAVEAAVAKMLPSTVSILVSTGNGSGVGSGIVLSADGYIATNHHVIDGKGTVQVQLYGGERYSAEVIGSDRISDLALLKIDAEGLTPATFGDSDELLVGETVMAIGTPTGIGYSETVTRGIISCKTRAVKVYNASGSLEHTLLMVQTDASVNPGNSGGPLIDRKGEVVGVVANKTVFYDNGSAYYADGMGLAIPARAAKQILDDLKNGKEPDRSVFLIEAARLGISGQNVTEQGGYDATGVLVTGYSGSAFDACNVLLVDDILVGVDGTRVSTIMEILSILEGYRPGTAVTLTVVRGGSEITVELVLGSNELEEN